MSLPAVFGTTVETVPWMGAYLGAEPGEVAEKRMRFPSGRAAGWAGLGGQSSLQGRLVCGR